MIKFLVMMFICTNVLAGAGESAPKECLSDARVLCADIVKENGDARGCLVENYDQIQNKECIKKYENENMIMKACKDDLMNYCKELKGGKRKKCVNENITKFKKECQDVVGQLSQNKKKNK